MILICVTLNEGQGQYNEHVTTMRTATVFEESLARETDTHTQTRSRLSSLNNFNKIKTKQKTNFLRSNSP